MLGDLVAGLLVKSIEADGADWTAQLTKVTKSTSHPLLYCCNGSGGCGESNDAAAARVAAASGYRQTRTRPARLQRRPWPTAQQLPTQGQRYLGLPTLVSLTEQGFEGILHLLTASESLLGDAALRESQLAASLASVVARPSAEDASPAVAPERCWAQLPALLTRQKPAWEPFLCSLVSRLLSCAPAASDAALAGLLRPLEALSCAGALRGLPLPDEAQLTEALLVARLLALSGSVAAAHIRPLVGILFTAFLQLPAATVARGRMESMLKDLLGHCEPAEAAQLLLSLAIGREEASLRPELRFFAKDSSVALGERTRDIQLGERLEGTLALGSGALPSLLVACLVRIQELTDSPQDPGTSELEELAVCEQLLSVIVEQEDVLASEPTQALAACKVRAHFGVRLGLRGQNAICLSGAPGTNER